MLCWEIFSSGEVPYHGYSNTKAREMIDTGKAAVGVGARGYLVKSPHVPTRPNRSMRGELLYGVSFVGRVGIWGDSSGYKNS